jgi:diacylglycerol kinase family enzyme
MRLSRALEWAVRVSRRIVPLVFVLGGIAAVWDRRVREQRYGVMFDGERADGAYASINIANGPCYAGNKSAVTGAMPNDGVLDALMLKSVGALQVLKVLPSYLRGGYCKYPELFRYRRARRVEISSDAPILVNLDGEVFFDTNLTVEVIPQAVNIVAVDGLVYQRRADARESQ